MSVYKVGVMSDLHGVFHEPRALAAFWRVMEQFEPNRIDSIGDLTDSYTTSKFSKDPLRMGELGLRREAKQLAPVLNRMDELSTDDPHVYMGNHDARPESYLLHNAPAFHGCKGMSFRELFELPERWNVHKYGKIVRHGKLFFTHGDLIRKQAGASALAMRQKTGGSVIMGHSHRLGGGYFADATGVYGAWEVGHLCKPPVYANGPVDWQQGFACVTFSRGGDFNVELVPIHKGKAFYRGEWV